MKLPTGLRMCWMNDKKWILSLLLILGVMACTESSSGLDEGSGPVLDPDGKTDVDVRFNEELFSSANFSSSAVMDYSQGDPQLLTSVPDVDVPYRTVLQGGPVQNPWFLICDANTCSSPQGIDWKADTLPVRYTGDWVALVQNPEILDPRQAQDLKALKYKSQYYFGSPWNDSIENQQQKDALLRLVIWTQVGSLSNYQRQVDLEAGTYDLRGVKSCQNMVIRGAGTNVTRLIVRQSMSFACDLKDLTLQFAPDAKYKTYDAFAQVFRSKTKLESVRMEGQEVLISILDGEAQWNQVQISPSSTWPEDLHAKVKEWIYVDQAKWIAKDVSLHRSQSSPLERAVRLYGQSIAEFQNMRITGRGWNANSAIWVMPTNRLSWQEGRLEGGLFTEGYKDTLSSSKTGNKTTYLLRLNWGKAFLKDLVLDGEIAKPPVDTVKDSLSVSDVRIYQIDEKPEALWTCQNVVQKGVLFCGGGL
jgi:hypothetical protein